LNQQKLHCVKPATEMKIT